MSCGTSTQSPAKASRVEKAAYRFEESRLFKGVFVGLNLLPLPYRWMPLRVKGQRMYAHTFDRYFALWMWKLRCLAGFESRLLSRTLKADMQAVDIGANIGLHTLQLAKLVGPTGRVWAIEADGANFATLQRNLSANGDTHTTAIHAAAGASSGDAFVFKSSANAGDHRTFAPPGARTKECVKQIALDDYFQPGQRIDFIKMDIQGAEGAALKGMRRVLTENPGLLLMMEFWPWGLRQAAFDPLAVLQDLQDLGFALEWIDSVAQTLRPIQDLRVFTSGIAGARYENIVARAP